MVSASELLRRSENAMPTCEKRRSTVAELAGQPRYCRAITDKLGNFLAFFSHHASASHSVSTSICGSARWRGGDGRARGARHQSG